ncbi:hypothetical protein BSPWISOXPB_4868 [uncultured Gammaproteobacteria bacterium]|nr:hypothetical protein BSPWISOXPB_4868 [uncultured Gammaproteobacteria bacterium]
MLDRHLLPENQLRSVERNIYSKLDTSRVAPSNENTPADFVEILMITLILVKNTNDNFNISEHTLLTLMLLKVPMLTLTLLKILALVMKLFTLVLMVIAYIHHLMVGQLVDRGTYQVLPPMLE